LEAGGAGVIGLVEAALLTFLAIVAAGVLVARLTGWESEEVLAAAPGVALLAMGGVRFVFYLLGLAPIADVVAWGACAIGVLFGSRDIGRGLRSPAARRALGSWTLLALWVIALAFLVRNYGAGNWSTDWAEHFMRARFFLGGQPYDQKFLGAALVARPPLANLAASEVMALAGRTFPVYQITLILTALTGFFPLLLLARELAPGARRLPETLAAWLMFSPMFVENATYTWTRQVAAWLVIGATAFYLRGRRLGDARRITFAFLLAAAGVLVHYSAAAYACFLGIHYFIATWPRRPRAWRELAAIAATVTLVLAPWILWSATIYGSAALLTTTASYQDAQRYEGPSHVAKVALNLRDSIVPTFVRGATTDARARLATWGGLRERTFMAYQSSLLFAPGLFGIALLVLDRVRRLRDAAPEPVPESLSAPRTGGAGAVFWIGFVAAGIAGIAANGGRDQFGLAHLSMQPVILLAIAWLAARFAGWNAWLRALALTGLAFDLLLGIALHFWVQSYTLDFLNIDTWHGPIGLTFEDLLIGRTQSSWALKMLLKLQFAGDLAAPWRPALALLLVALAVAGFALLFVSARKPEPGPG
jgi:hypothetical protein